MIHIITGNVNSGKTGKLAAMYQFENIGDGFVSVKEMQNGIVTGYVAMRLGTMEEKLLIAREGFLPVGFDPCCSVGPFWMSQAGLSWIEREIQAMLAKNVSPIYLDEIGPMELDGQGFSRVFRQCLASGADMYIAVRKDIVSQVIEMFGIQDYDVM